MIKREMQYTRIGTIGRFKPLNNGSAQMLNIACDSAERAIIGIGSCNKYDARNPFTAKETANMIDEYLRLRHSNYDFIMIPDYGHLPAGNNGQLWREHVVRAFGALDSFFTGNDYVIALLGNTYTIKQPRELFDDMTVRSSDVRRAMARNDAWQHLVPSEISAYITKHQLDKRFRAEFGNEQHGRSTLSLDEERAVTRIVLSENYYPEEI